MTYPAAGQQQAGQDLSPLQRLAQAARKHHALAMQRFRAGTRDGDTYCPACRGWHPGLPCIPAGTPLSETENDSKQEQEEEGQGTS